MVPGENVYPGALKKIKKSPEDRPRRAGQQERLAAQISQEGLEPATYTQPLVSCLQRAGLRPVGRPMGSCRWGGENPRDGHMELL